jgi:hypothetical protein
MSNKKVNAREDATEQGRTGESTTTRKAGGLNFRPQAEKAKAR